MKMFVVVFDSIDDNESVVCGVFDSFEKAMKSIEYQVKFYNQTILKKGEGGVAVHTGFYEVQRWNLNEIC